MTTLTLLSNANATGAQADWPGGAGVFTVCGTFNRSRVDLQYLGPDGATWIDVGGECSRRSNGGGVFELPAGKIRAEVDLDPINPLTGSALYATASTL